MPGDETATANPPNHAKRHRYAAAFTRIAEARASGFPIEAIMICESVITDRLVSHFVRLREVGVPIPNRDVRRMLDKASDGDEGNHVSTTRLVQALDGVFDDLGEQRFSDLPGRLRTWTQDRNRAAHAFVRTHPFTKAYAEPLDDFVERLDACAATGVELARTLDAWTRRRGAVPS
jgi:hypothetical protein